MTLQEILAQLLNPGGSQQVPGNQLSMAGAPGGVGDHNNPALLRQAQQMLAQPPQMAQMAQAAPPAAMPLQQAPQGQPMPQNAPQAAPGPSGGGLGGLLGNLFGGGARAGENQTVQWLTGQGIDPGTATMMAKHKPALQQYLLKRSQGVDPLDRQYKEAQIANIQSQIDERTNPSARDQFGLNPIYGKDADGNLVVMQPNKAGGLTRAELPEGVKLQPGVDKIDLGTAWGITDRSGSIISTIPKDLAGAEAQKEVGTARGKAAFDIPRIEQNAEQTLAVIEQLKAHPGRAGSTGFIQGRLPAYSGTTQDFQILLQQAAGKTFLEAFQTLKGGGQITEIEGKKATDAIARLNRAQSDEAFLQALSEFEDVIKVGLARARQQAGMPAEPETTQQPKTAPQVGEDRYGYRFKGGDPSEPSNWEKAN